MPAITTVTAIALKDKILDMGKDLAFTEIAGRYQQRRLTKFITQLSLQLSNEEINEENIFDVLKHFSENEKLEDALMDSVRVVSLSRSKIAPRLCALVLSKIKEENRVANEIENLIFAACDRLSDEDFRWFVKYYKEPNYHGETIELEDNGMNIIFIHKGSRPPATIFRLSSVGLVHYNTVGIKVDYEDVMATYVHSYKDLEPLVKMIDLATGPMQKINGLPLLPQSRNEKL